MTDLGGGSAVDAFTTGDLDIAGIPDFDARCIAYDETLGPQLRSAPALAVNYYGFDTTELPFDDARVRLAFAKAVDWRRLAALDRSARASLPRA